MTAYVALLRAVNVGGTGKLPMTELRRMCDECGFGDVQTYIASGNVVFTSGGSEAEVREALEARIEEFFGARVPVFVRTADEMAAVLAGNPFADAPGKFTVAIFLDAAPPPGAAEEARGVADERIALGAREIYVAYGAGMGRSKLRIPAAANGSARNMNTIAKLAALAAARA